MPGVLTAANFRFLFREDKGCIDRRTWWTATLALAAALLALIAVAAGLGLVAARMAGSGNPALFLVQGVYLTAIMHLLLILVFVCHYFVSAKRYNDLGKSPAMALVLPASFYLLIVSPVLVDQILPVFGRWIMNVLFLIVLGWQFRELGWRKGKL